MQDLEVLILTSDEHLGANLRVLLASLQQANFCAIVKTVSAFNAMLHHTLDVVFVDARELYGHKGKGLAECVANEAALVVIAHDGHDAVLAFDIEAADCVPLPLVPSRLLTTLERIGQ
jgi:DNA-binding LytR/AlgR family response regulator